MLALKGNLKAATLMESLIAMVIIIVCLGMGTMMYSNVMNSDTQRLKAKADGVLSRYALQIKKDKNYLDAEENQDGFVIKTTVNKYEQTENCYVLTLTASTEDIGVVAGHKELIIITE